MNPWPRDGILKLTADGRAVTWMVPSASTPGAFYAVTVGRGTAHGRIGARCTCPQGGNLQAGDVWQGTDEQPKACRHVRAMLAAEADDGLPPRPQAPPHRGLVDE